MRIADALQKRPELGLSISCTIFRGRQCSECVFDPDARLRLERVDVPWDIEVELVLLDLVYADDADMLEEFVRIGVEGNKLVAHIRHVPAIVFGSTPRLDDALIPLDHFSH